MVHGTLATWVYAKWRRTLSATYTHTPSILVEVVGYLFTFLGVKLLCSHKWIKISHIRNM